MAKWNLLKRIDGSTRDELPDFCWGSKRRNEEE